MLLLPLYMDIYFKPPKPLSCSLNCLKNECDRKFNVTPADQNTHVIDQFLRIISEVTKYFSLKKGFSFVPVC